MTALNGSKPPAPVYVVACRWCGATRPIPKAVPIVWGYRCACGRDLEFNMEGYGR